MRLIFMYSFIYNYYVRSDECGRIFCYRENGTRFHKDHVQVKDGSGRKTVPVWAFFSADGPGTFVRINGRLNSVKYIDIIKFYKLNKQSQTIRKFALPTETKIELPGYMSTQVVCYTIHSNLFI